MRAMIVAAGLGTRLRPLTELRPKPVVPVRGLPLLAHPLALLAKAGVSEVVINVHHLPERLRADAARCCPPGLELRFSHEPELLHTGGAIRRVADFLRESDPCLVVGGDMIVDLDLAGLVARHRASERLVTLALVEPRANRDFGTIGVDARGRLCRLADRVDLGGEASCGVYTWVNVLSARAFDTLPDRPAFNHLDDWWMPLRAAGEPGIGAEVLRPDACQWTPVGTPGEYLDANFTPLRVSYLDADAEARARGALLEPELVVGAGAEVPGMRSCAGSWYGRTSACPPACEPGAASSRAVASIRSRAASTGAERERRERSRRRGCGLSELVMVGTSDAFGSAGRRQSAYLVRGSGGSVLLDCAPTTNGGLATLGISRDEIAAIAVSHFHADHFGGIPLFLLASTYQDQRRDPLLVAGPAGIETRVRELAGAMGHAIEDSELGYSVAFRELPAGSEVDVGPARITSFETDHVPSSCPHGLSVRCDGRHLVYSGDTGWFDALPGHARGADLFLCECTFPEPRTPLHLSLDVLAKRRDEFRCDRMLLTHLGEDMRALDEAAGFERADDGDVVPL